ncbi:hypothetical protein V6Z11_A01G038400 [Gossypium hirsutum]
MLPPSSFQISFTMISPFSNQGLDCEYRHSEVARLNPRDCWYLLAGNCINPTCGFRHPPLFPGESGVDQLVEIIKISLFRDGNNKV